MRDQTSDDARVELDDGTVVLCDARGIAHQNGGWVIADIGTRLTVAEVMSGAPHMVQEVRSATLSAITALSNGRPSGQLEGARMLAAELADTGDSAGEQLLSEAEADDVFDFASLANVATVHVGSIARIAEEVSLERRGGRIPMPGAEPVGTTRDGVPRYKRNDLGYDPNTGVRAGAEGPEHRGAHTLVRPGTPCAVLDVDPLEGRCRVSVECLDSGPLHPHQLVGWVRLSQIRAT